MAYRRGNYTADHKGTGLFLMSGQLARGTEHYADRIAQAARRIAPRSGDGEGIPYADGIEVNRVDNAGIRGDRIGYEVVATEGHPTLVEWGRRTNDNGGYEGQHVMRRAIEEVTRG